MNFVVCVNLYTISKLKLHVDPIIIKQCHRIREEVKPVDFTLYYEMIKNALIIIIIKALTTDYYSLFTLKDVNCVEYKLPIVNTDSGTSLFQTPINVLYMEVSLFHTVDY